jgi:hypothetical protein
MPELPEPESRNDVLLNNIAIGEGDIDSLEPQSREEAYLKYIAQNSSEGAATWGEITGDITNQLDLNTKLDEITADFQVTLPVLGWSRTIPYTQDVEVEGILATDDPIADVILSDTMDIAINQSNSWSCISKITTYDGGITVTCFEDKPETDIQVKLKVVR